MNPLLKLFARAISVAEEFGSAGHAWLDNPNEETKAYLEECRADNLEAQKFFLEELKKVLPD